MLQSVDESIKEEMIIWRLVIGKLGTYTEICQEWSFDDIMKGNEVLDIKDDIQSLLTPKIKKPKGG